MAEHASVIRVVRYDPAPGKRDELISRLHQGAESLRQMDGCFGAQICSLDGAPNQVVAISRWASQGAIDQFLQQTTSLRAEAAGLARGQPTEEHFHSL
jgi:quinol monooxygenase YgiN